MNIAFLHFSFVRAIVAIAASLLAIDVRAGVLGRDAALTAVTRDLAGHYRVEGDLQLELLRPWVDVADPAATNVSEWAITVAEYPASLTSSLLLRVRFSVGDRTVREETLTFRAQLVRDVWVATTPLDRGATFDPSQLETRRVDVLREREAVVVTAGDRNFTYARAVPAGRLLTWRDLARRSLIRKGDVIEVAAVDGPLQITMKALAMENGAAGDTVRVRNLESRKEFAALVVAEARAQVRF